MDDIVLHLVGETNDVKLVVRSPGEKESRLGNCIVAVVVGDNGNGIKIEQF